MSAVVELDVLGGTPLFSKHELDRNKMNSQVRPRSLCVLPKTPMLSTRKLSSSIGVWKPCMPFQVMFLRVEVFDESASGIGPATAHCIAIRVPSATRMKSCVIYSIRMNLDNDRNVKEAYRQAVDDRDSLTLLNDIGQNTQCRRHTLVVSWTAGGRIDINGPGASLPIDMRCMNCVLNLDELSGRTTTRLVCFLTSVLAGIICRQRL